MPLRKYFLKNYTLLSNEINKIGNINCSVLNFEIMSVFRLMNNFM